MEFSTNLLGPKISYKQAALIYLLTHKEFQSNVVQCLEHIIAINIYFITLHVIMGTVINFNFWEYPDWSCGFICVSQT